jgi:prephenate dehydratase
MFSPLWSTHRLWVTTEADPGALARVLQYFQNLNVLPRKISAELATTDLFYIEVDVTGMSEEMVGIVTAKIGQARR